MARDKEKRNQYMKAYRKNHPEKTKEHRKKQYEKTKKQDAVKNKAYREQNKEKLKIANKKYYHDHPEKLQTRRERRKHYNASLKGRYRKYKGDAKFYERDFLISLEDYEEFFYDKECFYCGTRSSGIDRVDSNKGYLLSNCIPCCTSCNTAKMDNSFEEFIDHIKKIYEHLTK